MRWLLSFMVSGIALALWALPTALPASGPQAVVCDGASLLEAVATASDGATLTLASGCTISLSEITSTVRVTKPLTIIGEGAGAILERPTSGGPWWESLVTVGAGGVLLLDNITVRNNIKAGNSTYTDGTGGGLFIASGGKATLVRCRVSDNAAGSGRYAVRTSPTGSAGGGIYLEAGATLVVRDSEISNNHGGNGAHAPFGPPVISGGAGGTGGGIVGAGDVTVINSVISGNSGGNGGVGGYPGGSGGPGGNGGGIVASGRLLVVNTTISDNAPGSGGSSAPSGPPPAPTPPPGPNGRGGGIVGAESVAVVASTASTNQGAGLTVISSTLDLVNSTISQNVGVGIALTNGRAAFNNGTISGNGEGGLLLSGGSASMQNSILLANGASLEMQQRDCALADGSLTSNGYNLFGLGTGCPASPNDQAIAPEQFAGVLSPLGSYGGPTATHALPAGSPAIDSGNPTGCTNDDGDPTTSSSPLITDQRGAHRPHGPRCDSGAYEVGSVGSAYLPFISIP